MCVTSLLGLPDHFQIRHLHCTSEHVSIEAEASSAEAVCPLCGESSSRVHSRYPRTITDLPTAGKSVQLRVSVRRFRCVNPGCRRQVFCERLPRIVQPYARSTDRLQQAHTDVARSAGGEGGARLARRLGMPTSADTLLRRLQRLANEPTKDLVYVGVDDWAFRKGARYGTILIDLQTHRPVDLLPDRKASTVEQWFREHPTVRVVSRDRAGEYAKAAQQGAPQAVQIADRWHLLNNARQCLQRIVDRLQRSLRSQLIGENVEVSACSAASSTTVAPGVSETTEEKPSAEPPLDRRQESFDRVWQLHRQGKGIREISRTVGISRQAVRRYLSHEQLPQRAQPPRRSSLEACREYLQQRWSEGCHNVAQLQRELQQKGYEVAHCTVRRFMLSFQENRLRQGSASDSPRCPSRVSAFRLSWWLLDPHYAQEKDQHAWILAARKLDGELWQAVRLLRSFRAMVRQRRDAKFSWWLREAEQAQAKEMQQFAQRLREDEKCVQAALEMPWSNGVVEGHVHRLKLIKRAMYGRAGFALLRCRVLAEN
jgi:transposase